MKPAQIWTAVLLACIAGAQVKVWAAPNIVFILADDMGYGDVQALNSDSRIPTPNLNRLAAEGMTFTDAHTPSAVCTPTRYGLLTGRYCWRSRLKRGVLNGYSEPLIEADRPTVASFLGSHGYHCGIVGKWHLGLRFAKMADGASLDFEARVEGSPSDRGFNFSYIIPASLDFPPYVFIRNGQVTSAETILQPAQKFPEFLRKGPRSVDLVMADCLDQLLDQAQQFIQRSTRPEVNKPFFLYFPLTAPHKPVLPHPRFRGKTDLGPYGDFITQVDWTVGQLLNTLDQCGAQQNTLVVYTSDNGSFMRRYGEPGARDHTDEATVQGYRSTSHSANGPLRGTKADIWEAGHRVPFFVRWPQVVRAGSRCNETICLTDFFATAADLVAAKRPVDLAPDSYSFLPLLKGQSLSEPRPPVIHHSAAGMFAIREGNWKLVAGNGSGGRDKPSGKPFGKPYALFDLSTDLGERRNVIDQHPETAARLEKSLLRIRDVDSSGDGG